MNSKAISLLSLLPHRPVEFCERVAEFASGRIEPILHKPPAYDTVDVEDGMSTILKSQNCDVEQLLSEAALATVEEEVLRRQAELPANAPFARYHNGDIRLGRLCYAVARALRPLAVAETGVCYGVTSAYLLAALEANGQGHLYSIDLPPLGENGDDFVGWLVPTHLRSRWTLQRGTSARLLRPLLKGLRAIDLFIHDSLHTYRNMTEEFQAAWPALRGGGVLISDDVEGNPAFLQLMRAAKPELALVIQEKNKSALLGVAVKRK
jgi:predicted O-methyltransferase YrrM